MILFHFFVFKENRRYSFDIFHAERFACKSEFLFSESGISFVSQEEQLGDQPKIDFYFTQKENLPVTSMVGGITIGDVFSVGKSFLFPKNLYH